MVMALKVPTNALKVLKTNIKYALLKDLYSFFDILIESLVFFSRPHFLNAETKFIDGVVGQTPSKSIHDSFLILEPVISNFTFSNL